MRRCELAAIILFLVFSPSAGHTKTQSNPLIKALMAMANMDSADASSALDVLIKTANPFAPKAIFLKARAMFKAGKLDRAKKLYARLVDSSNKFVATGARFGLSQCLARQKKFKEAEEQFSQGLVNLSADQLSEFIAGRFERLGDEQMEPPDVQKEPDPLTAQSLYSEALKLDLPKDMTLRLWLKEGKAMTKQNEFSQAADHYLRYLNMKKYKDYPGKIQVSIEAARSLIKSHRMAEARLLLSKLGPTDKRTSEQVAWLTTRTFGFPAPSTPEDLLRGMEALKKFIRTFPKNANLNKARLELATSPMAIHWSALAEKSLRKLISSNAPEQLMAEARFKLAQNLFSQEKFTQAARAYEQYIRKHPNHKYWSDARMGIIAAHWEIGQRAMAEKEWKEAGKAFFNFATLHPSSYKTPQALTKAADSYLKADDPDAALRVLKLLTSKFANTAEGWEGLITTAKILIENKAQYQKGQKLLKKAASDQDPFPKVRTEANNMLSGLPERRLLVEATENFTTGQQAYITLRVRNIEDITIRAYRLKAGEYFRDLLSMYDLTSVDIALCEPDKTWKVKVEDYKKYIPIKQKLILPFKRPGVYLLNLVADDMQATTAVRISDLGIIVKQGEGELLAFAQDRRRLKPMGGVKIILADGERIIAQGSTEKDGTWIKHFEKPSDDYGIIVFAQKGDHVAWIGDLHKVGETLQQTLHLAYMFQSRPVYNPGDRVDIAGIYRKSTDGHLGFSGVGPLTIKINTPDGAQLASYKAKLDEYGTFHQSFLLDEAARPGNYYYSLFSDEQEEILSNYFQVVRHTPLAYEMIIELDHQVVMRGEDISGQVRILHSDGAAAVGKPVTCAITGSNKVVQGRTDQNGIARFTFHSKDLPRSSKVEITAFLSHQKATANVYVADARFSLGMKVHEKTIFTGQEFGLDIYTTSQNKKTLAADVKLEALFQLSSEKRGEIELWSRTVPITATGTTTITASISRPGIVILRAMAKDDLGNPVITEKVLKVVGKKEPGIWIKAKRDREVMGKPMELNVYSRLDKALVLLTCENTSIRCHHALYVHKGQNHASIPLTEDLAPEFRLSAAAMDGHELYQTSRIITIDRTLSLEVRPDKSNYGPGDEVTLTIIAKNATGKPADARLLVSVVDSMLLKEYPEHLPELFSSFYRFDTRLFETKSSATRRFPQVLGYLVEKAEIKEAEGSAAMAALKNRRKEMTNDGVKVFNRMLGGTGELGVMGVGASGYGSGGGGYGRGIGVSPKVVVGKSMVKGGNNDYWRRNFDETAIFRYDLSTGPDGVASVHFKLPDTITRWRVAVRATTKYTLLGQSYSELVATKAFFAKLIIPQQLEQGDKVHPLARIFNYTNAPITAAVELSDMNKSMSAKVHLEPGAVTDHVFDATNVSAKTKEKVFKLRVKAPGYSDKVVTKVPVRPRGVEVFNVSEGWTENNAGKILELESGATPTGLQVQISDRLGRFFIGNDLQGLVFGDDPANALIALQLMKLTEPKGDTAMLDLIHQRLRAALLHIQSTQKNDGGWGWTRNSPTSNTTATCDALRALLLAKPMAGKIKWIYPRASVELAQHWLEGRLSSLPSDDLTDRARIVFALAHLGKKHVPTVVIQRLHRLRSTLSLEAKALVGLTWLILNRPLLAKELAESIETNALLVPSKLEEFNWQNNFHISYTGRMRALELLTRTHSQSFGLQRARSWLQSKSRLNMCSPRLAEATLGFISAVDLEDNRGLPSEITVKVNGKTAGVIKTTGRTDLSSIHVPAEFLRPGKNQVEIKANSMGSIWFRLRLDGYLAMAPKNSGDKKPKIRFTRHLEPVPRDYKGIPVEDGFSVVKNTQKWFNQINGIGLGKKLKVTISIDRDTPKTPLDNAVLQDRIPPGFKFMPGSQKGPITHMFDTGRNLAFFLGDIDRHMEISYMLMATNPGSYEFPPPRLRSLLYPGAMLLGDSSTFQITTRNKAHANVRPTPDELFHRGIAAADQKDDKETLAALEALWDGFDIKESYSQPVLENLLFASIHLGDNSRILKYFELAKEKNPSLLIPFKEIGAVQKAYRTLGVYEGGLHLDRGLAQAMFTKQLQAIGFLESIDQIAEAADLLKKFLVMYPIDELNAKASYAFSQVIFQRADLLSEGEPLEGFDRPGLLELVIDLMADFVGKNPQNPQAPAAIFSMASAMVERGRPEDAVAWCEVGLQQHKDSQLAPALSYLEAFAYFSMGNYDRSLKLCHEVEEKAQNPQHVYMAQYIMAQIYHAQGRIKKALEFYSKVADDFQDAQETINELERSWIHIPDVLRVPRSSRAMLEISAYNTKTVDIKVYRVDLMKLYLLKGSLSNLQDVNLAGISPIYEKAVKLNARPEDGTQKRKVPLSLPGKGAYLLLVRGAGLVQPCLVLVDALEMDVNELVDEGRARVAVRDSTGHPLSGCKVEIKGENNSEFMLGNTDLRGIFIGDDIDGAVTVIAKYNGAYGLYRGKVELLAVDKDEERYRKKSAVDFEDDSVQGDLQKPSSEYLQMRKDNGSEQDYKKLFNQEVKGMNVNQAL